MRTPTTIGFVLFVLAATPHTAARQTLSESMRTETVQYAVRHRYLRQDIPALTAAIEKMARTLKPASLARCTAPMKLVAGRRESAAALLVNPVCGECSRVVDVLKKLAGDVPSEAPTIYIGEVPSSEAASAEAVVLLHNLADDPDARLALLQEFLTQTPSTVEGVRALARAYAPALVQRRERHEIQDEPPCDPDVLTPVIIYRDRILQKTRSGRIAFDPLRNEESLRLAMSAVDDLLSSDATAQEHDTRGICSDTTLARAIRIMDRACTPQFCSGSVLRELEQVNRADLLKAFRDPHLMAVHLFFPTGITAVSRTFDWHKVKRDQLGTISYLNYPDDTVVFIVSYASGGSADATALARERMHSVYKYLKYTVGVKCRHIKGVSLGTTALRLRHSDAELLGLSGRDYRSDEKILNQGVHVFTYPCADLL